MLSLSRGATLFAALFALGSSLAGCDEGHESAQAAAPPPAPQVTVAKPTKKLVSDHDEYVGRFVAVDFVEVRARVAGYLQDIHFQDGQLVKKGDLLFTIDPRPFQAALDQSKAAVQQAEADLSFASSNLQRGQSLRRGTVISEQTLDQRLQADRVATASLSARKAAKRSAELDLQYTELRAAVSGRIGDRRVAPGNLVRANETMLATIASVDPIRFEFTMDEASYLKYSRSVTTTATQTSNRGLKIPVELKLIDEDQFGHEGQVDFVDNVIDQSTGTIRGRAEFPNPTGRLTPGMFGRIRLAAAPPAEALLVPDTAIGTEQVRKFVYTLDKENVAQPKYVTLGQLVGDMRVVTAGLDEDDKVVVKGLMRIRPGTKVAPQMAPAAKTALNATEPEREASQAN